MAIYRVNGSVISMVYTDVSADTPEQALEIARNLQPEDFTLLTESFGIDNDVDELPELI